MAPPLHQFVCAGCRENFLIGDPRSDDQTISCPVPDCARPVWLRVAPEPLDNGRRLLLGTNDAPDFSAGPYVVDRSRLLYDGEELISGPREILVTWSHFLNDFRPKINELPETIRRLIQVAPRGVFVPGPVLVRAGRRALAKRPNSTSS